MSRLADAFNDGPALIAYLMAGDPDLAQSRAYMEAALKGGADVLEVGVPFSDPVADGPAIQKAGVRALEAGTTLDHVLQLVKDLRARTDKPLVLMTYYNPVWNRGLARFAADAATAGVDGVILPDVPLEESAEPGKALAAEGVDLIQLASPASPSERVARLAEATAGFLYVVSSYGVTGAKGELSDDTRELVTGIRDTVKGRVPVCVGFGVSTPDHVRALTAAGADGVIVGSAIVGQVEAGAPPHALESFVRGLKAATRA